jgi:hypothetical protein
MMRVVSRDVVEHLSQTRVISSEPFDSARASATLTVHVGAFPALLFAVAVDVGVGQDPVPLLIFVANLHRSWRGPGRHGEPSRV